MKILVTGGCGFIGTHIVESLAAEGSDVRVLDRNPPSRPADGVEYLQGDIRREDDVKRAMEGAGLVYHLAAQVSVPSSMKEPVPDLESNGVGTLNVLESARKSDSQVIFASSAAVYGNPLKIPVEENHPRNPLSPYGISKLAAESYCMAYAKNHGLKTAITRFSNVYGPGNPKAVIFSFASSVLRGEPVVIEGDGEQSRDFVFVKDAVNGLKCAQKAKPGEAFNISSGMSTSINQIAEALKRNLGSFELSHSAGRPGDIRDSVLSNSKAMEQIGFRPSYGLDAGLAETVEWIRGYLKVK